MKQFYLCSVAVFVFPMFLQHVSAQSRRAPDQDLVVTVKNLTTNALDQTEVAFNTDASDTFDPSYDANKFGGALNRQTLYTVNEGHWMAINTLYSLFTTSTVPMGLEPGKTANFTFHFDGIPTFDSTCFLFVEDYFRDSLMHNMRYGDYVFHADSSDQWSRFMLHFGPPVQISTSTSACGAPGAIYVQQQGPADWNYVLIANDTAIFSQGVLNSNNDINLVAPIGNYRLVLTDTGGYTVTKLIAVTGYPVSTADFSMPDSTIADSIVMFDDNSVNAAVYEWTVNDSVIIGDSANLVYAFIDTGIYNVTLKVTSDSGCTSSISKTIVVYELPVVDTTHIDTTHIDTTHIDTTHTGIKNVLDTRVRIYGNGPRLYVDFGATTESAVIQVFNLLGQEVFADRIKPAGIYTAELNNVVSGYVIARVKYKDATVMRKILIQR